MNHQNHSIFRNFIQTKWSKIISKTILTILKKMWNCVISQFLCQNAISQGWAWWITSSFDEKFLWKFSELYSFDVIYLCYTNQMIHNYIKDNFELFLRNFFHLGRLNSQKWPQIIKPTRLKMLSVYDRALKSSSSIIKVKINYAKIKFKLVCHVINTSTNLLPSMTKYQNKSSLNL